MAIQQKLTRAARSEAHSDAVAAAGDQAAADDDARAGGAAQPGDGREPAARRGPDRGARSRRDQPHAGDAAEAEQEDRRRQGHVGRRRLRVLLRRVPRRRLPPAAAAGSQRAPADREHALDEELARRPPDVAAQPADEPTRPCATSARPSSATSTRTAIWSRRSTRSPRSANWDVAHRREGARARAGVRSDRRRRARSAGVPAAAAAPPAAWPARRPRRSSAITCACSRTTGFRSSPARSDIEPEEVKAHIELIKHLDPRPGARYSPADSQYVIPDVYIVKTDDGYKAVLNEDGLPQLRISPVYRRLLDKGGESRPTRRAPT